MWIGELGGLFSSLREEGGTGLCGGEGEDTRRSSGLRKTRGGFLKCAARSLGLLGVSDVQPYLGTFLLCLLITYISSRQANKR